MKNAARRSNWPIDLKAGRLPAMWQGWPGKSRFAFILTHDVDTAAGFDRCLDVLALEKQLGFKSSFNFVPERYPLRREVLSAVAANGFEVGVHGLKHDGKLYNSYRTFRLRREKINSYLSDWQAVGFRSPSMHHNLGWIQELNIEYDSSTFDTDPFEPQSDGVQTIFPFWVEGPNSHEGYVEMPYTLPQDFTLFVMLREKTDLIWKKKLEWIVEKGGLALMNTHPDYMNFASGLPGREQYPVRLYEEFLKYVSREYAGMYWHVLPKTIARFYKQTHVRFAAYKDTLPPGVPSPDRLRMPDLGLPQEE